MSAHDADWMLAPLPSGRHGLPREYVVRSQRLRLIAGAIAVAGEHGYAAMTVSSVIAHAGISRKTFYEQFADREECFLAAYDMINERALAGIRAMEDTVSSWPERLRVTLGWALSALAAHPREARIVFLEVLVAGPLAQQRRERALRALASLFAPGHEAAPEGVDVPASMETAVAGALCELIGARIRAGEAAQLPELLPDLLYCALAPFVGPREAAAAAAPTAPRRMRGRAPV